MLEDNGGFGECNNVETITVPEYRWPRHSMLKWFKTKPVVLVNVMDVHAAVQVLLDGVTNISERAKWSGRSDLQTLTELNHIVAALHHLGIGNKYEGE